MQSQHKRILWIVLGVLLFVGLLALPTPAGLGKDAHRAIAIFTLCVFWWLTTPVDLPVTALVGLALVPIFGILPADTVFSYFGNQAIFFVIGVFLIAAVMMKTGLSTRLALLLLSRLARNENQLALAVLLLSMGLCSVIVSHAVAAILLPILLEILHALKCDHRSRFAKRVLLSMAWGTVLGSNTTLLSSARAALALSLAQASPVVGYETISLVTFSKASVPLVVASIVPIYYALRLAFPPANISMGPAVTMLHDKVKAGGAITRDEWVTAGVVVAMVSSMVLFADSVGLGSLALIFSALLFFLRIIEWNDVEKYVAWGVILLYGGAIALGQVLQITGAASWVVNDTLPLDVVPAWVFLVIFSWAAMVLTELISNSGVVVLLMPIGLNVAVASGINPAIVIFLTVLPSGLGLTMPTGTPAMAMIFGSGFMNLKDTIVRGPLVSHLLWLMLMVIAFVLWPLMGMELLVGG